MLDSDNNGIGYSNKENFEVIQLHFQFRSAGYDHGLCLVISFICTSFCT